jgi:hypothetical protein
VFVLRQCCKRGIKQDLAPAKALCSKCVQLTTSRTHLNNPNSPSNKLPLLEPPRQFSCTTIVPQCLQLPNTPIAWRQGHIDAFLGQANTIPRDRQHVRAV